MQAISRNSLGDTHCMSKSETVQDGPCTTPNHDTRTDLLEALCGLEEIDFDVRTSR